MHKLIRCLLPAVAFACSLAISTPAESADASHADPMDWPYVRGPEMNSISREKNLVEKWDPRGGEGSNLLWKREDLGGRSTPIVMNGLAYVIVRDQPGTINEGEKVVCVDAATGETKWEYRWNVYLSDVPDTRVGWSSVVGDPATGNVYALGVCDYFVALNGKTGEKLWDHSLNEEYGMLNTYGGRTNFPIIHRHLVIVSGVIIGWGETAKPTDRLIAFDTRNGQPVWYEGTRVFPYDTTYSAPVTAVLNGQDALVFGSGDGGVHAFQPQTGKNIFTYNVSRRGINTSPLVVDNTVYSGHSEENIDGTQMGALFALDGTKTGDITKSGEKWRIKEWFVGKSAPLYIDGRLYACEDSGTMLIVDPKTGKKIDEVKLGGPMRGNPLYADGKIHILTENGRWWVLEPTEDGVKTVTRGRLNVGGVNASPIVSHGRFYIVGSDGLFCVGDASTEPEADPRPEPTQPTPRGDDDKPAHLQVVPVESILHPGQKQQYSVRLYNERGQYLRTVENAEFSIEGQGEISAEGMYTTPGNDAAPEAVQIVAKAEGLTGEARLRVLAPLPWKFTFDSGNVPVTFVGARYRHIGLDFDLFTALDEKDPRAAQLYIDLMTNFTNVGNAKAVYNDDNPRRRNWTGLLIYTGLDAEESKPKTLDAAKKLFDPSLQTLKDEEFISGWEWSEKPSGFQLSVDRGPRKDVGNGVMCKIRTIPLGTKSQGWMGQPDLHDYTIQADVRSYGNTPTGKMPDIGLIAQRYTLDMRGAKQELQIRTWAAQNRMAKETPFEWKHDTWYTIKLQASTKDGKAVLRAKAWPRDDKEPEEWMLEATDPSPNVIGSPGMFGNARDSEVFYDNIIVTPNES